MQLSGIGEQKAGAIIKYRETNGFFKNIEDIMMVEGIKDAMYKKSKIRYLCDGEYLWRKEF